MIGWEATQVRQVTSSGSRSPKSSADWRSTRVCAVDPRPGEDGVVEVAEDVVDNGHDAGYLPCQACDDGGRGSPSDSAGQCRHTDGDIDSYLVGVDPHRAQQN